MVQMSRLIALFKPAIKSGLGAAHRGEKIRNAWMRLLVMRWLGITPSGWCPAHRRAAGALYQDDRIINRASTLAAILLRDAKKAGEKPRPV